MALSISQTNYTTVTPHPRIHLSPQLPNDKELIQAMMEWCNQQFGSGLTGYIGHSQCQWAVNRSLLDTIFFQFRTQQQLDWFMLKWM